MNARFWEWIATVNARLVFLWTSLMCLGMISSGVLFSGHGTTTIDALPILGDPGDAMDMAAVGSRASTPTAVENEEGTEEDPFASKFLVSLLQREQHRKEAKLRRAEAQRATIPTEVAAAEPSPAPVGPPRLAQLLYRGMFTRPDGTVLALVENQATGEAAFVRENDQIEGLLVGAITRSNLTLGNPPEDPIILATGEPAHVELEP